MAIDLKTQEWDGKKRDLFLFDVNGTLTKRRQVLDPEMYEFIQEISKNDNIRLGFVSRSNLIQISSQLGQSFDSGAFRYRFGENGLVGDSNGIAVPKTHMRDQIGEHTYKKIVQWWMRAFFESMDDCPMINSSIFEMRRGLLNVSLSGRDSSTEDRKIYDSWDPKTHKRRKIIELFNESDLSEKVECAIGEQNSVNIYPRGWDKTYCLRHIPREEYNRIHFFGDETELGGNDYALFSHPEIIGHTVTSPTCTRNQIKQLLNKY